MFIYDRVCVYGILMDRVEEVVFFKCFNVVVDGGDSVVIYIGYFYVYLCNYFFCLDVCCDGIINVGV